MVFRFAKRNPFLCVALIGLALNTIGYFANVQYDDGGVSGLVFWLGALLAVPVTVSGEIIFLLVVQPGAENYQYNWTHAHTAVAYVMGFAFCVGVDCLLRRAIRKFRRAPEEPADAKLQNEVKTGNA